MLAVNTEVHLGVKLAASRVEFNDLAGQGRQLGYAMARAVLAGVRWSLQERELARVRRGQREVVCWGCGVVHRGTADLLCRGRRSRLVQTSVGPVRFALRQLTCRLCRATFCPFTAALGLRPRQRIAEELLAALSTAVLDRSYRKTCALASQWLGGTVDPRTLWRAVQARGVRVRFTRRGPLAVVVVDGTRVRAGARLRGEAAVIALQLKGRYRENGRRRVQKRVIGFGLGQTAWLTALGASREAALVVTDAAAGVREAVSVICPEARHQLCEWHLPYSLHHFLTLAGVRPARRRALARELGVVLRQRSWRGYHHFRQRMRRYRQVASLLREARRYIMYREPSAERTTSIAEREMREINRRTDVGARWSQAGIEHLLQLQLAHRHNPDDYSRVWPAPRPVHWQLVSQTS